MVIKLNTIRHALVAYFISWLFFIIPKFESLISSISQIGMSLKIFGIFIIPAILFICLPLSIIFSGKASDLSLMKYLNKTAIGAIFGIFISFSLIFIIGYIESIMVLVGFNSFFGSETSGYAYYGLALVSPFLFTGCLIYGLVRYYFSRKFFSRINNN